MTFNRRHGAAGPLLALILMLAVAGCGGSSASNAGASVSAGGGGGGGGGGASAEPSSNAGAADEDTEEVGQQLIPPNSSEVSKTTTATYWYVIYESSDSPESLKSYYEGKIPSIGMMIISTTSAQGGYSFLISRDEAGSFGGAVGITPSGTGSGTTVIVSVGS